MDRRFDRAAGQGREAHRRREGRGGNKHKALETRKMDGENQETEKKECSFTLRPSAWKGKRAGCKVLRVGGSDVPE